MTTAPHPATKTGTSTDATVWERVSKLMGGKPVLKHTIGSSLDAHDVLLEGLPGLAVHHLVDSLLVLDTTQSLEDAMGFSLRTFQRSKEAPTRHLSVEQSGRAWKFAEILSRATEVFGSQEEAERWLDRPATGLDGRRPIELLSTPAGVEIVETFLTRLEHGVYM